MVKIPGLDELKKMGTDLIDSAKTGKLNEMVDKFKSGIESIGTQKGAAEVITDDAMKNLFQGIYATLNELTQAQTAQVTAIKKMEKQLEDLAKQVEKYQKPSAPTEPNQ